MLPTEYRPCVVAVFTKSGKDVLVCERADHRGSWQFPQGGIEPGESALNALYREMREELGCDDFKILKEGKGLVKYRFPDGLTGKITQKWVGQSQVWFLCEFNDHAGPDMKLNDGEFVGFDWRTPDNAVQGIVDWKQKSYIDGLSRLGFQLNYTSED